MAAWKCPRCGEIVGDERSICRECGAARPAAVVQEPADSGSPAKDKGLSKSDVPTKARAGQRPRARSASRVSFRGASVGSPARGVRRVQGCAGVFFGGLIMTAAGVFILLMLIGFLASKDNVRKDGAVLAFVIAFGVAVLAGGVLLFRRGRRILRGE